MSEFDTRQIAAVATMIAIDNALTEAQYFRSILKDVTSTTSDMWRDDAHDEGVTQRERGIVSANRLWIIEAREKLTEIERCLATVKKNATDLHPILKESNDDSAD